MRELAGRILWYGKVLPGLEKFLGEVARTTCLVTGAVAMIAMSAASRAVGFRAALPL